MALIMGVVTMIRMTSSVPRKITEAALYGGNSVYYDGPMMKAPAAAAVSNNEYMAMMKRMAELEEKVTVLSVRPIMPPEKEEMLNNALSRVSTLEQELGATKKVLLHYFVEYCKIYKQTIYSCVTFLLYTKVSQVDIHVFSYTLVKDSNIYHFTCAAPFSGNMLL
jgi:hypothetical protein